MIVAAALTIAIGSSCSGGGCGGCGFEPIPGGFPSNQRNPNAVQVRVTQSGLTSVSSNPAALLGSLGGSSTPGVLEFNVPANCGGQTPVCCPNGQPMNPCGPIDIDLNEQPGDLPRLELRPQQNQSRLDVTVRARIKTAMDIPVNVPIAGDCGVKIDTTAGTPDDVQVDVPISFEQDATAGTTNVIVGDVAISNLKAEDVALTGGIGCQIANLGTSFFLGLLTDQLTGPIKDTIQGATCKSCPSGDVGECGPFADACDNNTCMKGGECLQELGLDGRARGTSLFGSFSPGTTGAIDLYEVAGGYATTNTNGLALGLLGGMLPAGADRDRCGPPATAPQLSAIPVSSFFQGNTRPDNNQPFDVGFGIHKSQLEQFAYAGYDGGLLCLTISGSTVSQLNTDTISLLSRSLANLVDGNAPVAIGLRPQSPPTITLGRNIFTDDGNGNVTLTEPLLDITFSQLEIDFFAAVDDQYVRVFTVVTDVHFPVGLQVTGMGELAPVIGNPDDAFTNLSVKNSEALTEDPQDIADLFPTLLSLVLPQLSNGLAPISLPDLGGLQLDITDVTAVDNVNFLAIFANLAAAQMQRPVDTTASIGEVYQPPMSDAAHPRRWRDARQPTVQLHLGGTADHLEYSWQIDHGAWSPWSKNPDPTLHARVFWLPGTHTIDVRARRIGQPETVDLTPVSLAVELGINAGIAPHVAPFHGAPGSAQGCNCDASGGDPLSTAPLALLVGLLLLPMGAMRRRIVRFAGSMTRRVSRRSAMQVLGSLVVLAIGALAPGCSCGNYCGDAECIAGDIDHGGLGRWTSIGADDSRVLVATYDQGLGDLVAADVTTPDAMFLVAVDGIPDDVTPTHNKDSYRKGIEEPGPDVGAWTSVQVAGGLGMISYQDREAGALKFARETKETEWTSYVVDGGNGEEVGRYTSLALDADGHPAIAYTAIGTDDGAGHRITELRIARAGAQDPKSSEWTTGLIAQAPGTCAGLCGSGEACIDTMDGPTCTATTADCNGTCSDTEACIAGTCTAAIADPEVADIATGTGLFTDLVVLPDARLAAVYYDRNTRELKIAVEDGPNTNTFTETVLDGGGATDRGMWASAVADGAGTVHIAYQDALGDQLFYTTVDLSSGVSPGTPEVVDDGTRMGETRTHNVGAAASIYLVGGSPQIAYQDGLTSDVYLASNVNGAWTVEAISSGPLLDGFSIGATTGHGQPYLAWDRLDPSVTPPNGLFVQTR